MRRTPRSTLNDPQIIADLKRQLAESNAERDEAQQQLIERTAERDEGEAQKAAISEVLGVINSSPGDLGPVFDAMLEKAMRLCEAAYGHFVQYDGDLFHRIAVRGKPAIVEWQEQRGRSSRGEGTVTFQRLLQGETVIHVPDVMDTDAYRAENPAARALVDIGGCRTLLTVALRRGDALAGLVSLYREGVRPFSDKQIALLQNFAAQAVIAMENARLITETREALEQQTATSEVLGVINSSLGDLAPVFDAMLEKAMHLCEAAFGLLALFDGGTYRAVATRNLPEAFAAFLHGPQPISPNGSMARITRGESLVQIVDISTDEGRRALVIDGGARTTIWVALRKDGAALGCFNIYRQEVRPFSDKQIALLENFAAQAVIAMENARLITETREALEQQTATAEVLGVINSSPGDLAPVFDAMLEKATRLCDAPFGNLRTWDGERFHFGAVYGDPQFSDWVRRRGPVRPDRKHGSPLERIIKGERVVHFTVAPGDEGYWTSAGFREMVAVSGMRSGILVALAKDEALLGTINVYRQEVQPFSDKQIALLQNFAAQAVIAMENARLITETREALEQQTATAEVLQVINSSPGDLAPVFDALLEKVTRLCEASFGIANTYDGDRFHTAALHGVPQPLAELWLSAPPPPAANSPLARIASGEDVVHIEDFAASPGYLAGEPRPRAMVELGGAHSYVAVALRKDGKLLGTLAAYRQEVHPFTDKQIALLQNFAAQAVIAIENARLITETREALEQQTATAEVLQVINSSPGDLAPVFDAMLEKATRLCEADFGILWSFDGELATAGALHRVPAAYADMIRTPFRPSPESGPARMMRGDSTFVVPNLLEFPPYHAGDTLVKAIVDLAGARTVVIAPLRKDALTFGAITVYRQEVRPFSDKQIALLQNFAAQAVIAIENARLITETREALDQQTATAEVLQVINSSPGELAPVFEAMLDKAMRLCEAAFGYLATYDGEFFNLTAACNLPAVLTEQVARVPVRAGGSFSALVGGERIVHIADLTNTAYYQSGTPSRRAMADLGGARTVLWVALRKENTLLGSFVIYRREVRPFSDKQIALLKNFAGQAVIAMENARLITETREALEQQTATAEVLGVINASRGDLAPVFDAILEKAHSLCGVAFGFLQLYDSGKLRAVALRGVPDSVAAVLRQPIEPTPGLPPARLLDGERIVQEADMAALVADGRAGPRAEAIIENGVRTALFVPLRKDADFLGCIAAFRKEVQPFSNNEIALLENFASQAVIAMENARLITETREALEQQTATAEVLGVINSSPGDLAPVFDAMLEKALHLCGANFGQMNTYDGEHFHHAADHGVPAAYAKFRRDRGPTVYGSGTTPARLVAGEGLVHTIDLMATEPYKQGDPARRALVDLGGARSHLTAALRKGDILLGDISIYRQDVHPFTDKQIGLLRNFAAQAVIAIENARLITETREALEQQTATSEVLGVINSSPGDLGPVFDAILEKAHSLCGAATGSLRIIDGDMIRAVAFRGQSGEFADQLQQGYPFANAPLLASLRDGAPFVHISDVAERDDPISRLSTASGNRTMLAVPLRKDDALLGMIVAGRQEVRPFSDKQIALLQNFAAQAVIAMENARLITETREALEQQTATAEVLSVINSSPGDLVPVFDVMLGKALRLCEATYGQLSTYDGDCFDVVAIQGEHRWAEWIRQRGPAHPEAGTTIGRIVAGERVVHVEDITTEEAYLVGNPTRRALAEIGGFRTLLSVALRKDETVLGVLHVYRQQVRPFTDKQIALLQNFAAQAVIAMENARLLTETREALEQQTATAEVLQVINSSPGDLAPVFDAMLDKAMHLCTAAFGMLRSYDGERFNTVAARGVPDAYAEFLQDNQGLLATGTGLARLIDGEPFVHSADAVAEEAYGGPVWHALVELGRARAVLAAPLRKDGKLVGAITVYRQEARAFSDKQIALLQNFAAQAVIAMENARLITETREALEQQTATAEVLGVINSSPGDLAPVFDAILEKAHSLCGAAYGGLVIRDTDGFRAVAARGDPGLVERWQQVGPLHPPDGSPLSRLMLGEKIIHLADAPADDNYRNTAPPDILRLGEFCGLRTLLMVPLRTDNTFLGVITAFRLEVQPFTEKEIALLENFAAQAVIAMENARLLGELRQRTDEVGELNRGLEARVAEQVNELGRVGRLKRFLAPQLAELIVSQGDEKILESHRREIVVVFCDLRGYTAFTETAEPEEVLEFLRQYHGALGPLVSQFEGTLDQFSGDGIMVFFNDPVPCPDPAERAVKMAVAMREAANTLIADWRERGRDLGFGAGIAQGYATLGQIGFSERSGYTAIGTVCNVAARLCAEAKDGQILLGQLVNVALKGSVATEQLGPLTLKGLSQPVVAYNVPLGAIQPAFRVIEGGSPETV